MIINQDGEKEYYEMLVINRIAWVSADFSGPPVPEDVDITTRIQYRPSKHAGEYRKEIISITAEDQCLVLVEDATAAISCGKQISDASGWSCCLQTSGTHWGDEHDRILQCIKQTNERES